MKKDLIWALAAGLIAGAFLTPTLKNLELSLPYQQIFLFIFLPAASILWIAVIRSFFGRGLFQFAKFAVTGGVNATIDFGILNILISITGLATGQYFVLFKALSFIAANINSYFWNKRWTFEGHGSLEAFEYIKFLIISLGGLTINVGMAALIVNGIGPQFGISLTIWANIGALSASVASLLWNFFGYKFVVFR